MWPRIIQIKYGPIDFQVREPASPLFANIPKSNAAIELQVTQEYLGQQCHLVYLAPLWKTILDLTFVWTTNRPWCGMLSRANVSTTRLVGMQVLLM